MSHFVSGLIGFNRLTLLQVRVEHMLMTNAMEQVLLCAARLLAVEEAEQLVTALLTTASLDPVQGIRKYAICTPCPCDCTADCTCHEQCCPQQLAIHMQQSLMQRTVLLYVACLH